MIVLMPQRSTKKIASTTLRETWKECSWANAAHIRILSLGGKLYLVPAVANASPRPPPAHAEDLDLNCNRETEPLGY